MYIKMLIGGRKGEVQLVRHHIGMQLVAKGHAEKVDFDLSEATKVKTLIPEEPPKPSKKKGKK